MRGIMPGRLLRLSVLALAGVLMAVLVGHMWDHYSQQAEASGLERYLGAYVISPSKDQALSVGRRARRAAGAQKHWRCTTEILELRSGGFDARFLEASAGLVSLILPRASSKRPARSVPTSEFGSLCGILACELRKRRTLATD